MDECVKLFNGKNGDVSIYVVGTDMDDTLHVVKLTYMDRIVSFRFEGIQMATVWFYTFKGALQNIENLPFNELPLHINHEDRLYRELVKLRLENND